MGRNLRLPTNIGEVQVRIVQSRGPWILSFCAYREALNGLVLQFPDADLDARKLCLDFAISPLYDPEVFICQACTVSPLSRSYFPSLNP